MADFDVHILYVDNDHEQGPFTMLCGKVAKYYCVGLEWTYKVGERKTAIYWRQPTCTACILLAFAEPDTIYSYDFFGDIADQPIRPFPT